jgi:peptide/nickel transport system substrate-binding protein
MSGRKSLRLLAFAFVLGLLFVALASCGPSATEAPTPEAAGPTEAAQPQETAPVEPTPQEETSITILMAEDPPNFNGVVTFTGFERLVQDLVMLGVADLDPRGEPKLELAAEVPTVENGGVVLDEENWTMDATWKMRDDVFWQDGEPVTADDVVFTWDAITNPDTGIWMSGVDYTDSIEKIDDYTFVVHYNSVFPGYAQQFGSAFGFTVFPAHYCDAEQGFVSWDCNYEPLSNGPYILEEWERGDHLTFVRNPTYYEEGKPYIDKVYVRIVPEPSVRKTMLINGEGDVDFWLDFPALDAYEADPTIQISYAPTARWLNHIWPNQAAYGEIDPVEHPHPILSDVRVRRAMRMAIDVREVIDGAFDGRSEYIWTEFFRPPYECDIPEPEYSPEKAMALLEEAGWTDTDGDGVRECHGCTTGAPEGYQMSMEFIVWLEGGETYQLAQQLIAEDLEAIGMNLELSSAEGTVLWDTYDAGGVEQRGNFDMNLWDDGYAGTDPTDYLWLYYHSDAALPDSGWNVERWLNPEFDALLDEAYTLDEDYRKELFCQMAELMDEEVPTIPLFDVIDATGYNPRVEGIQGTVNDMVSWNIADWKVVE